MSVWNPDNIKDVAESVGISALSDNVVDELARDVDFRITQLLEEALKFMRHGKRTALGTQDISNALRVLNVEPLYGYESTRPLRFGEASIGPGQPLYYVEDEEVDFEKMINSPLPKVPKEITFTGMTLPSWYCQDHTLTSHSALASSRRRSAWHTSEPHLLRLAPHRAAPQGPWREPPPGCRERPRQCRGQAASQARPQ